MLGRQEITDARTRLMQNESMLRQERDRYIETREKAEAALRLVMQESIDHAAFSRMTRESVSLLLSGIEDGLTAQDRDYVASEFRRLADLVESRPVRGAESEVEETSQHISAAEDLLRELSQARLEFIESLRQDLDRNFDQETAKECIALLKEETELSLLLGDAEGASRCTSAVEMITRQITAFVGEDSVGAPIQEGGILSEDDREVADHIARQLAKDGVVDAADIEWFKRQLLHNFPQIDKRSEDFLEIATKFAVIQYEQTQRRVKERAPRLPTKSDFVGSQASAA